MRFFYFLTQKKFYLHLVIIILLTLMLLWLTFRIIERYTRHDEVLIVPDFTGDLYSDVEEHYSNDFCFVLSDSAYMNGVEGGTIIQQDPLPGAKVKQGRNVYYVVVAKNPEAVEMPNLRNLSLRQALVLLRKNGLELEYLNFVDYFAQNAVVEQYVDSGVIEPGTKIFKGEVIKLDVGNGQNNAKTLLPNLVGAYYVKVRDLLFDASLNVGKEVFINDDVKSHLRVYRTEPEYEQNLMVPIGQPIKIWYRSENLFDFEAYFEELRVADSVEEALKNNSGVRIDTTDANLNEIMGSDEYIESVIEEDVF